MDKYSWGGAEEALRDALKMEKFVTKEIKSIIDVCSTGDGNVSAQDRDVYIEVKVQRKGVQRDRSRKGNCKCKFCQTPLAKPLPAPRDQ